MPNPKQVFDEPDKFWKFMTAPIDDDFEDQFFDRKEACRANPDGSINSSQISGMKEHVQQCISGFANANVEGGLLVLGIAKDGTVKGVGHLTEKQFHEILDLKNLLIGHSARVKSYNSSDETGVEREIVLIYAPYSDHAICET